MIDKLFIEISNVFDNSTRLRTVTYELNKAAADKDYILVNKKMRELKSTCKQLKNSTDVLFRKYEEAKEMEILQEEEELRDDTTS